MSDQKQSLSRRDALKALVAATGAVTLAGLPQKWATPVVQVGALPAHAQASQVAPVAISSVGPYTGTSSYDEYELTFRYNIPAGATTFDLQFTEAPSGCSGSFYYNPSSRAYSLDVDGTPTSGTGTMVFLAESSACSSVKATVVITDNDSNTHTDSYTLTL